MKKIVIASLGLLSLTVTSFSFASGTGTGCTGTGAICQTNKAFKEEVKTSKTQMTLEITAMKDQEKTNRDTIKENKNDFHANFAIARKYLIKPLSGDKREAVNTIIKTKDTAMKTLQTETNALVKSGTVDRSGYITKATDILTSFRTSLLPYVAADQTTAFDTFIQEKINLMITNIGLRQSNQSIKMQIGNKRVSFKTRLANKKTEYKNTIATIKASKKTK